VRARPFSYLNRDREVPEGRIEVNLTAPSGGLWQWEIGAPDPAAADAEVAGTAVDFCLVVTQRRHVTDTALSVTGDNAVEWLSLAQAFAGPPGPGRPPRHPD
jgi:uncharacterized protein (TIGR03084 family)